MADQTKSSSLWTPHTVAETRKIYADWADTYDDDITAMAYATPDRIAAALTGIDVARDAPVLDFGCGTGLSGIALKSHGFTTIDGTDISPEMLAQSKAKQQDGTPLYRRLWLGTAGQIDVAQGDYTVIVATGVISLGAAPAETLNALVDVLSPGGILAFSYNDPTLADATYVKPLDDCLTSGQVELLFREHGPHLNEKITGSDVIVLRRR